jgi:hypothetical protein
MSEQFGFAVQAIQAILAPALMVSACGLLLLGLLNRYQVVMNRIRVLNEERRKLKRLESPTAIEAQRLRSVARQLDDLADRVRLLRNAVVCQIAAVGCFVVTSLLIGLPVAGPGWVTHPLQVFLVGMAVVFAGLVFAALDVLRAYRTIRLELSESDSPAA